MRTLNDYFLTAYMDDVSTAGQVYVVAPDAGKLIKAFTVLDGTIATAPAVLTFKTAQGTITQTISIEDSGSAAGDVDSAVFADNNYVEEGGTIEIETSGASTNTVPVMITLVIRR